MPMPISHNELYNQDYQTAAYPNMQISPTYAGDMHMRRVDTSSSSMQFRSNPSMLGLPGGNANDLLQQLHPNMSSSFDEGQLDPLLLAYDGGGHSGIDPSALQNAVYQNPHPDMQEERLEQHNLDGLLDLPHDEYQAWQSDPTMVLLEQESEFDKWMGEQ